MLFRKIGRRFSGMNDDYMFDDFLSVWFTFVYDFFSLVHMLFMIYGLFCLSTRIEPQGVLPYLWGYMLAAVSGELGPGG